MRLVATADLHYNIARSREPAERAARSVIASAADAVVLLGDLAGADKSHLDACLALFAGFAGGRFFVAGNHSLWSDGGADALTLLRDELPARGKKSGFTCLEYEPAILGPVGLVGTVGWYDYSFRDEELGIPLRFYQRKIAPGAARFFSEYRDLFDRADDLGPEHFDFTARWMDGAHVRLPMSDEDFTKMLADKLADQLDRLAPRVDRIVVAIHHVPFANMLPTFAGRKWRFVAAFMGSDLFGQACLAQPKVTHILCGHTHQPLRVRNGSIDCINIGSTYEAKRIVELEL